MTVHILDALTGEVTEREFSNEEKEQRELDEAAFKASQVAKAEFNAKRQGVLDKLGITAEEVLTLLA